jgi:hypothetical protein
MAIVDTLNECDIVCCPVSGEPLTFLAVTPFQDGMTSAN